MREWKMEEEIARVENEGVGKEGGNRKGEKRETKKCRRKSQGLKEQEYEVWNAELY